MEKVLTKEELIKKMKESIKTKLACTILLISKYGVTNSGIENIELKATLEFVTQLSEGIDNENNA